MDLATKKALEQDLTTSLAKLQGNEAVPAPVPAAEPTPAAVTETPDPEPETAPEEFQPEAAPTADEWAELKTEFGSAKAAREHLENLRAMQATAHDRNAESARERQEARELFEATRRMQSQIDAQTRAISQMGQADPAAAAQLLAAMGQQQSQAQQVDPALQTLNARLEQMERMQTAQRFAQNQAITVQAANEAVLRSEVLSNLAKIDNTLANEAAQEVVQRLYDRDMRSPGTVVPTNQVTFAPLVMEAVRSVEKKYRTISEGGVKAWKARHALTSKQAPPSSKGPSASARTAPTSSKPPPNMTMRARGDWMEKDMKQYLDALNNAKG